MPPPKDPCEVAGCQRTSTSEVAISKTVPEGEPPAYRYIRLCDEHMEGYQENPDVTQLLLSTMEV
jgi:hypothetical protein